MPGTGAQPATGAPATSTMTLVTDQNGNLTIDMGPLRRELLQQVLPQGKRLEELSTEERQKLMSEVNQRLLGVQLGLQISAAEVQKRAQEAEREAAAKDAAAGKTGPGRARIAEGPGCKRGPRRDA